MLIVKGSIYRDVSEKEAEKFKEKGYAEVKSSGEVKAKVAEKTKTKG